MKMGINMSDTVSTVSETYAEEIKTPAFGEGLDYAIRMNANDVCGIINGIDYKKYNPAKDQDIYNNYSLDDLKGKMKNKRKLQTDMGLPTSDEVPVISIISRLVEQKGIDLVKGVIDELMQEEIQLVILGTGDNKYESFLQELAHRYPKQVAVNIKYDANLAKKIYAGSDIFLMPSKYEPCGLSQLISLRYGTIPVVRETGGLKDTISSYDEATNEGNGFSFTHYNGHSMLAAIRRAIKFYHQPQIWKDIVVQAMKSDFSWNNSAQEYVELYYKTLDLDDESERMININQATINKLKKLKSIGPVLAQSMLDYREESGGFKEREELLEVSGIGKKKYELLKNKIKL